MKVELTRNQLCDLLLACTSISQSHAREAMDMATSADRKAICERTVIKWDTLRDELSAHLDAYDAKHNKEV